MLGKSKHKINVKVCSKMKKKGNKYCSGTLKDSFYSKFLKYMYRIKQAEVYVPH